MIYEVNGLTFSYASEDRKVLDNASLTLDKGEILCILGPNGAGKTTLLNCMAGFLRGQEGQILLCDQDIKDMKVREIAKLVGYVPQMHTPAFDYRVIDFVLMGRTPKLSTLGRPDENDMKICLDVLDQMELSHLANKSYINISGGERQKVLIARSIVQEPRAILFDEPTAHLDFGNQQKVLKQIKKMAAKGFSVIITTHNPDHALLLGDKAAIVDKKGHITQGKCEDIITEEKLRQVYDIDLKLLWVEELGRKACIIPEI